MYVFVTLYISKHFDYDIRLRSLVYFGFKTFKN